MKIVSVLAAAILFGASTAHMVGATDAHAIVAVARQRIEQTDARGTGRLVRVDADGKRISNAVSIKEHWFPGVLRVLLEIVPSRSSDGNALPDGRVSILFEMRPTGQNTIRVFRPHDTAPASLPFSKWGDSVAGTDFSYEDFLQSEVYWADQTFLKSVKLGARDCDVLKSAPGASDRSHYADVQTWFDHTIGYPVYVEKTPKDATPVKEFTSLGVSQSGGVWSARQVEVKVHSRPGSSLLMLERGSTKANLSMKDFSPEKISHFEDH